METNSCSQKTQTHKDDKLRSLTIEGGWGRNWGNTSEISWGNYFFISNLLIEAFYMVELCERKLVFQRSCGSSSGIFFAHFSVFPDKVAIVG